MTLSSVSPYRADAVPNRGAHAVVVGGSMAGLMTARVLADAYDDVTLLERDPMPDETVARRGVPQSNHVHAMLEPARVVLNDLFPGYQPELREAGGLVLDASTQLDYFDQGGYVADPDCELPMPCASRPLFEQVVRRRVAATDGVTIREECQFTAYLTDGDDTAVEGVAYRDGAGKTQQLEAALVVDATGRTSRTHDWLADNGYESPSVDRVDVDLAYGTVNIERPDDERGAVICVPSPPEARGGVAIPAEDNRWIVTLFGMHGDHPPTESGEYIEFADTLPTARLATLLRKHEWRDDEIQQYPFPASQWRHYERLDSFPDGLAVTGDAIASFNPIYGQGMSAAALDALQLHHTLAADGDDIGPRFFTRATEHLDVVWKTVVGADFAYSETEGPKPFGTDVLNRYISRLIQTAHEDRAVAEAYVRVLRLEHQPTSLFNPHIAARVLLPG